MAGSYVGRVHFVDDVLRFHLVERDCHNIVFAAVAIACELKFFFILLKDIIDDFFHNVINGQHLHLLILEYLLSGCKRLL